MRKLKLDRLRAARGCSQAQMAKQLGMTQAAVSKIEFRTDSYVSTIRRYVESLGGKLKLHADFPGEEIVEITGFDGDDMILALKGLKYKHFQIHPLNPATGRFQNSFILRDVDEDARQAVLEKSGPGILVYIPLRRITEVLEPIPPSDHYTLTIDGEVVWFPDKERWRFVE